MKTIKKILNWFDFAERTIMVVAFALMVACMFGSVLARNVFKATIPWFDELARIAMVYMVLLGAEAGLRDGTQVSVTVVTDKLKGKAKQIVAVIAKYILAAYTLEMTYTSIISVQNNIRRHVTTTALNWPVAIPYMGLVLGFGIMFVVQTGTAVNMTIDLFKKKDADKEDAA